MLQTEKQQLRRYYREARRTLSSDEKRFIDCKISDNLLKSDLYRDAACIFCYVSTSDEIGTAAILEQALTDGKTLCVPLCGRAGEMSARRILSLDELKSGAYGIPEPSSGAPEIPPDEISLVIVPALSSRLWRRLLRSFSCPDPRCSCGSMRGEPPDGCASA